MPGRYLFNIKASGPEQGLSPFRDPDAVEEGEDRRSAHHIFGAQAGGVTGGRRPNHCSASQAWNRSTSVNPSFAARRIEPTLAVWVASTTGSPGRTPSSQSSAAAHLGGVPESPRPR